MKYILASASPRRREILSSLDFDFEVITSDVQVVEPNNAVATPVAEETKPVEVTVAKPKQKAKVKYKNGKIVSIEPVVSDEEKKKANE